MLQQPQDHPLHLPWLSLAGRCAAFLVSRCWPSWYSSNPLYKSSRQQSSASPTLPASLSGVILSSLNSSSLPIPSFSTSSPSSSHCACVVRYGVRLPQFVNHSSRAEISCRTKRKMTMVDHRDCVVVMAMMQTSSMWLSFQSTRKK